MTHGELFVRILTEASGKSRDFAVGVVEETRASLHGRDLFDVELSDREAERILRVLSRPGEAAGTAGEGVMGIVRKMTRGDVFTKILSEVSGKSESEVAGLLDLFLASIPPGQHKFDEELSDAEAESLLAGLRKEKAGIASWLMQGYRDFVLSNSKPKGHA